MERVEFLKFFFFKSRTKKLKSLSVSHVQYRINHESISLLIVFNNCNYFTQRNGRAIVSLMVVCSRVFKFTSPVQCRVRQSVTGKFTIYFSYTYTCARARALLRTRSNELGCRRYLCHGTNTWLSARHFIRIVHVHKYTIMMMVLLQNKKNR